MKHNERFRQWPQLLLENFVFFLIGTENVKQNHTVLNAARQSDEMETDDEE